MNVLSLFDGISCGMVALERAGISVEKNIMHMEIEKNAIKISQKKLSAYYTVRRCDTEEDFRNTKAC